MNESENARITMYGAPWCPDCQQAKKFLDERGLEYAWVNIDRDEAARRRVEELNDGKQIIPTIVFPDGSLLVEPSNAELAEKLGLDQRASRKAYDLIVVGGGPAGLAAALYAAREGIQTLVIERSSVGGQAAVTEKIENYPGFPEPVGGKELAGRFLEHGRRFGVEVLPAQDVNSITTEGRVRVVRTATGQEYCSPAVLLAPGTQYRRLGVPGEEDYIGAGIHFCATCDGPFYKGKEVLVVGGGNSGVQEAIFLSKFASKVTVVERMDRIRASKALQDKADRAPTISIRTSVGIDEFTGDGRLSAVLATDLSGGGKLEFRPAGVFVFIGLDPNTEAFKGTVELDDMGFIRTDATLMTSHDGVFAAGDARAGSTKQVASAVGDGVAAALMIRAYLEKQVA